MDLKQLQAAFPEDQIEWRIGRAGYTKQDKLYGTVLAYINNRAIMQRLDEVCGPTNWKNEFREWTAGGKSGVLCGLSIWDEDKKAWCTKYDGADNTDIEPLKGGLSDAMKRAAVQFGIGRYLYDLEEGFAQIDERGKHFARGTCKSSGKAYQFRWNPPSLPVWALPADKPLPPKTDAL